MANREAINIGIVAGPRKLGVDSMMAEATVQRLRWSASPGLSETFGGMPPHGYKEIIKAGEEIGLFPKRRK